MFFLLFLKKKICLNIASIKIFKTVNATATNFECFVKTSFKSTCAPFREKLIYKVIFNSVLSCGQGEGRGDFDGRLKQLRSMKNGAFSRHG